MDILKHKQILIIGGGPAGATTSLFLAKFGVPHILLDKSAFPRDKVCGDGLDLKVIRVFNELNPALVQDVLPAHPHFRPMQGLRYFSPKGNESKYLYQPKANKPNVPLFYTSKRQHFDDFLIQQLDSGNLCDFRPDTEVISVERNGEKWTVNCKDQKGSYALNPDFIIGADGDHSVMLRFLKQREIEKTHYAATLRQYWANVADMDTAIEVYTPPALPMSYFYMFPLPNNEVNVGYGMTSSVISKKKHNLRALFAKLIQEDPVLAPRFAEATPLEKPKGWGLPLASLKRKTFGDGYLLVGDAASLVGPTSGEGIGTGMMSGFIAASFLRAAINLGDLSQHQFRNYDREVYRRLKQEIGLYRTVMRWQPWFLWDTLLEGAHLGLVHRQFQQQVSGWIKTAYTTKIDVKLD